MADVAAMSIAKRGNPSQPDHVALLAALWPEIAVERVAAADHLATRLPASEGRCGIYVLSFADGERYVGQAVDVVSRFRTHRKTYDDIVELHFWRHLREELDTAEQAAIQALQNAGLLLRNVTYASGRLGASRLDAIVTPTEQQAWLTSTPADALGEDTRPDRPQQRVSGKVRFDKLVADQRFKALLPAVRSYLARTIPFPRRTEFSCWSISARPATNGNSSPRLLTVTVHSLETLFVFAPFGEQHRTIFVLNVDLPTMQRYWGADLDGLADAAGAPFFQEAVYAVRPGVLSLEVEGPRNLVRLLDVDGVVDAARRLNLDMMRKGPALQWRSHSFDFADLLFQPATEPAGDPLHLGWLADTHGDINRAEQLYQTAFAQGSAEAAFHLGELCNERGDDDRAEIWYRRAADAGYQGVRRSSDFGNTYPLMQWAHQYEEQGDLANAALWYRYAAEGGRTDAYLRLGDVEEDLELAAQAYQHAADNGHSGGWFGLGLLHHDRGDLDQAESYYRRAAEAGHPAALAEVGSLHAARGESATAENYYRQAVRAGDVEALVYLGDLFNRRGETDNAQMHYRRAVKRGSITGLIGLALIHEQTGDSAQAQVRYQQAIDLGHTHALINLGHLHADQGDDDQAAAFYRDALDAGHTDANLHLGDLMHSRGDHDAAELHYRLAAADDHNEAVARLGRLFLDLDDLDAAEPLLRVAATHDPEALDDFNLLLQRRGSATEPDHQLPDTALTDPSDTANGPESDDTLTLDSTPATM